MSTTTRRPLTLVAGLGALALVSGLIVRTSSAAFTATTQNTGNSFAAGTVELVDDDGGVSSLFTLTNLAPGDVNQDCITVTYQGTIPDPGAVVVYSGGYADSGNFADYLLITIDEGTGGSFGDCTGFTLENNIVASTTLTSFNTTYTNYASGAGVWDPVGTPESKTYRVTVTLDAATPNAEQGESVSGFVLTWEVNS